MWRPLDDARASRVRGEPARIASARRQHDDRNVAECIGAAREIRTARGHRGEMLPHAAKRFRIRPVRLHGRQHFRRQLLHFADHVLEQRRGLAAEHAAELSRRSGAPPLSSARQKRTTPRRASSAPTRDRKMPPRSMCR